MSMRVCNICQIEKPFEEFHKQKHGLNGIRRRCKTCANKLNFEYRQKNGDLIRAQQRITRAKHNKEIKAYHKQWRTENLEHVKGYRKEYKKKNPDKVKASYIQQTEKRIDRDLKRHYGIGIKERQEMFFNQEGKCGICYRSESDFKHILGVDHDHETGQVRELLCGNCNKALGSIKEDFQTAINLAKYIQKYKEII